MVECLTHDRRAVGSSLTGVTALWSLSKTHLSYLSTGSTQEEPSRITERLLSGRKESKQTKQTNKTADRRLSSIGSCLFKTTSMLAITYCLWIVYTFSIHLFKLFTHFKYQRFIVKTCTYLFVLQIRPTGNSYFRF